VRNREASPTPRDLEHIGITTTVTVVESHGIAGLGNGYPDVGIKAPLAVARVNGSKAWHTSKLEDASSEEYKASS
jgi:hypothetical protein